MADQRDDLTWRAARDADLDALTVMLDAATRAHRDEPATTIEVANRLATPGCVLSEDTMVVEADGVVVGFSQVWATPPADVRAFTRVHPDWRGLGLGSALAAWALRRATERAAGLGQASVRYSTTAWAGDRSAPAVLRAAGLHELRHFLRMVTSLPASAPVVDTDIALDTYVPGRDEDALWSAYRASFAEHWGAEQPDEEGFWWDVRDAPAAGYDPTLWTVTRDGGDITGFSLGRVSVRRGRPEGFVMDIGVRPAWRSKRIGQALLAHTLRQFEARGLTTASLDVDADNVTDALRLYRSVGMTAEPAFTIWGTELRPAQVSP
ncbi:MAG: mycothiol synthase [Actinomycetota bacterium]|jgi:mycothiol synthase|nr:mycothiol synthase [Actinomycetota bacterium]